MTIDTASDSHDHIKHVIDLLQRVVGASSAPPSAPAPMSMFDSPQQAPQGATGLMDMFGAPAAPAPSLGMFDSPIPQNPIPDPQHNVGNPLSPGLGEKEEKVPHEIEFY